MPGPSNESAVLALPYPAGTDAADAPTDMQALVDRIEELLLGGDDGAAGFAVGDFKTSARTTSHGRWLLCDTERELTQTEIETELGLDTGQAAEITTILGTGASSAYGSAASGKVKIPGFRDQVALIAGPNHPRKGSGSSGGEETHTLTSDEMPNHSHSAGTLAAASHSHSAGSLAADAHQHGAGSLVVASHTHAAGTLGADSGGSHTHGAGSLATAAAGGHDHGGATALEGDHVHDVYSDQAAAATGGATRLQTLQDMSGYEQGTTPVPHGVTSQAAPHRHTIATANPHTHDLSGTTASGGAHTHSISGNSAAASPGVNGNTGSAGSTVSGATGSTGASVSGNTSATGGGQAHNVMQPYRVIGQVFIRV